MRVEENTLVCTRSTALPSPTRSVEVATEYLAEVVHMDMGTKNGKTSLYWNLIHVIQQHARNEKCCGEVCEGVDSGPCLLVEGHAKAHCSETHIWTREEDK